MYDTGGGGGAQGGNGTHHGRDVHEIFKEDSQF